MFLSPVREALFPNLRAHGYRVTSQETLNKTLGYNCVAWAALGDKTKWWESGNQPDFFWPAGVLDDGSFQSYVELFQSLGYATCNSQGREIFYEKIALFAYPNGDFSHVCYQLFLGWSSKLGDLEDIRHKTLVALEGDAYGAVSVIMKKRSSVRGFLARVSLILASRVWPLDRDQAFTNT